MKGRMKKAPRFLAIFAIPAALLIASLLTVSAADLIPPHSSAALEKAKKVKVSAVKFDSLPLRIVISMLHDESVRRDPERKGVKISLGPHANEFADTVVNLELKDVILAKALERVAEAVGLKLEASDTELLLVRKQAKQQSSLLSLLGTWAARNGIVKFAEDGTFESWFTNQINVCAYEGRWLTRSNMLIMTTIKSNGVPSYNVTDCKIIRADGSRLIYSINDQTITFVRKWVESKPPHSSAALEKAKKAKVSAVKFDSLPLRIVISMLHDESVRRDPERKGVKISLRPNANELAETVVNLELKDVTLAEALERVAEAVGLKLEATDTELLFVRKRPTTESFR